MIDLDISLGKHRAESTWKVEYMTWDEFVEKLQKVRRTNEVMSVYDKMSTSDKGKAKDGPSFVGGLVRGGRRKKESIDSRSLVTLDADFADEDFIFTVELVLGGTAYAVYSTHSHRPAKPKYRLIVPVDRAMEPDEYAAVSRKLAEQIGITYFDKTTFDVHRLMYFPSCSKDAEPVLELGEGEALSVDETLARYTDWRDIGSWPRHPEESKVIAAIGQRAQDPRVKQGTIGLFCRAFGIEEGIETFLTDFYEVGTMERRYTYVPGSSANGLEVYPEQELAFSHQDSDPVADGRTYNLFDLVRVHKFGHLDDKVKEFTPDAKKPSHTATEYWAANLPEVKKLAFAEKQADYSEMVDEDEEYGLGESDEEEEDEDWEVELKLNSKTGQPLSTAGNVELILSHGRWRGVLAYDGFGNTEVIRMALPWRGKLRERESYEPWLGADDKRLQHWMAKTFDIKGGQTIINAFTEVAHSNRFHPIKDFLESVEWDGLERLETVFIDYQGAEDSHYVRQVTRKILLAAVKRVYEPGCKFDEMVVLVGKQGTGKSTILARLGGKWFSDSLKNFENKEAGEHLQNGWIFEIGEMQAMKKAEVEGVKAFLSKTEDRYRVAYDRQVSEFPRKCVFFGTTNNREFLVDDTGNRRFFPIEVATDGTVDWADIVHSQLTDDVVRQIWAEARHYYLQGESLTIDREAKKAAQQVQADHFEEDPRAAGIRAWLDKLVEDEFGGEPYYHNQMCAAQVWVECLHRRLGDLNKWESRAICSILTKTEGWVEDGRRVIGEYGRVSAYKRPYPKKV